MSIRFKALEKKQAQAVLSWRYAPPYDCYNYDAQNYQANLSYLLEPQNAFFAILNQHALNQHAQLEGFCSFGSDAQVPGGDYSLQALDIGMELRPDLTGQGHGKQYAQAVMGYGIDQYPAACLRVTIAKFNDRAQRVWHQLGFEPIEEFLKTDSQTAFISMTCAI